ncbi:hypothetical protein ACOACQ_10280 [Nocardioides sp. CPCC 206347]|uniref:hypothetical protein n=1 Tax=unclassified Nocardioides TaxID=2615069 RepID=UPI0036065361
MVVLAGTTVTADATAWSNSISWGSHLRSEIIFDNSGSETLYVRDAYVDSYGAYGQWWAPAKSGTCNDTNGGGSTSTVCGSLNIAEGADFDANLCSKDYDGSTLRDSICTGRFEFGNG